MSGPEHEGTGDRVIRVLIVDDHEVVRQGLLFVLSQEPGFEVVGQAADGVAALAAIRRLTPDVVLLDMVMPILDGLGVLLALRSEYGDVAGRDRTEHGDVAGRDRTEYGDGAENQRPAVIVLTSFPDDERAMEAVRVGALSYLPKTAATDRVIEAVRAAATGGSVLDPGVAARLVHRLRERDGDGPLGRLSARERDVLAALSRGRSNREIARALSLGEQTVKSYVSSILTKLDLQDRTQAAIFGLQQGLVPLGEALRTDK
jgi:NarL family two-component system response regulator LiaR